MAIPSSTTIANLAREYVVAAWYPGGLLDQFIRKVGFQRIENPSEKIDWNRATSLPVVSVYGAGGTLPAVAMETTKKTITMRRIGDVAEVDTFQESAASEPNNQLRVQIEAKKVAVVRQLGTAVINAPVATFDSLEVQLAASQKISLVGPTALPTKEDVHRLVYKVTASDGFVGGGCDCLVANERVVRYIIKLMEDSAGGALGYRFDPDVGGAVPLFNGIPVYVGQVQSAGAPPKTGIWALKVRGPTGIRILHGSGKSTEFGIEVREVPIQATVSKRGSFVGGFYGLLVPEEESIAKIENIDVTTLPP